ncbi:MAG: methionine biosynthesis protein MetW [Actinomycetota bacterium]
MNDTDQVRVFEDARWSRGEQTAAWRHRVAAEMVRAEPVLDVGGGDGLLLKMLRERGIQDLHLVDLSPVGVANARDAGFDAAEGDVTARLPFEDDAFATVCALDVLEHLREPLEPLRELGRVGREVIIAVPNFQHLRGRLAMLTGRVPFQNRPQRGHVFWINRRVLSDLIEAAGLRATEWRYEPSSRLGAIGRMLARRWPSTFAVAFAVRLTKG